LHGVVDFIERVYNPTETVQLIGTCVHHNCTLIHVCASLSNNHR